MREERQRSEKRSGAGRKSGAAQRGAGVGRVAENDGAGPKRGTGGCGGG